jgi:hypothetical protein
MSQNDADFKATRRMAQARTVSRPTVPDNDLVPPPKVSHDLRKSRTAPGMFARPPEFSAGVRETRTAPGILARRTRITRGARVFAVKGESCSVRGVPEAARPTRVAEHNDSGTIWRPNWYGGCAKSESGIGPMPTTKRIIVLANSIKKSARCIAGIEVGMGKAIQPTGWIRPISSESEGELEPRHMRVEGGGVLNVLDIVDVPLTRHANDPVHPEDWEIDLQRQWVRAGEMDHSTLTLGAVPRSASRRG